jgi:hypothetical protein
LAYCLLLFIKLEKERFNLCEKTCQQNGRKEQPTAGIINAQSAKSTLVSSESKGFDAGKKVKGIKRHIIVDTMALVFAVVIQSASVQDRDGAIDSRKDGRKLEKNN